uniref:G-protein coupled receptors family 2 profile 2 domain-containing protein n=1 Tax=Aquila chrysaetos chrysaetos TaxID=223781 RepID=A0A663FHG9_AQUCH
MTRATVGWRRPSPTSTGCCGGGGDPHHILQELLAILDGAFGGEVGAVPKRHHWATMLLEATEGLVRGVGALLPPPRHHRHHRQCHRAAPGRAPGSPPPAPCACRSPGCSWTSPRRWPGTVTLAGHWWPCCPSRGWARYWRGLRRCSGGVGGTCPPPRRGLAPPITSCPPWPPPLSPARGPPAPPRSPCASSTPPPDPQLGARVLCAFWDPQEKVWATAGCREVTPHPGTPPGPPGTTCACNHLTSFAVLMAFHELEDDWVLDLVTKVGLGVSVVSLVVAAATFLLCRALKGLRTTLHLHLSLSLLLAHSTFLLGIDRTQHPTACAVVAGVLHFSFLAAFCWMCPGGAAPLRAPRASLRALVATRATPPPGRLRAARPPGHHRRRRLPRGLRDPPLLNAVVLVVTVWKLVQKFNDVNPDMGHLRKMRWGTGGGHRGGGDTPGG